MTFGGNLRAASRTIAMLLICFAAQPSHATTMLTCQINMICAHGGTCQSSTRRFALDRKPGGKAVVAELRGSVRIREETWGSLAGYWILKEESFDEVSTLFLGYDLNFILLTVDNTAPARISQERARRGGPIAVATARIQTMTGECS